MVIIGSAMARSAVKVKSGRLEFGRRLLEMTPLLVSYYRAIALFYISSLSNKVSITLILYIHMYHMAPLSYHIRLRSLHSQ